MVDYKTIVSTTDSKVTLMQWLQALAKEFDNAKITDIAFVNDGNSSLTFTFTLTDGTAKTATCKAITLTDDEKAIVSGLVGQVATSADGITFNKAVTFAGNIVAKGNEIHQGYESHLGDESHAGTEIHKGQSTFTDLRADGITATDGQDLLSYDGTNTSLKGKGTRPLYNTSELALKSDVNAVNKGIAEYLFAFKAFQGEGNSYKTYPFPSYLNEGTDYTGMYAGSYVFNVYIAGTPSLPTLSGQYDVSFGDGVKMGNGKDIIECRAMFFGTPVQKSIKLRSDMFNGVINAGYMFASSNISKVEVEGDGIKVNEARFMFMHCNNLTEIGNFDFSSMTHNNFASTFHYLPKLTALHCTHFKYSFDLSYSTALTESALVEVLNNLDPVTTTQTLTMGATNLAKLTSDDILIATGKGWALA